MGATETEPVKKPRNFSTDDATWHDLKVEAAKADMGNGEFVEMAVKNELARRAEQEAVHVDK